MVTEGLKNNNNNTQDGIYSAVSGRRPSEQATWLGLSDHL